MQLKKGLIYVFIANFISLGCTLVTGLLLPKFLNVETYANIKLFQLYVTYCGILNLGFAEGMYLKNGGKSIDKLNVDEIWNEIKTYRYFQLFISVITMIITLFLKQYILFMCSLVLFPVNMANYFKLFYQSTGMFDKYSKFTTLNTLLLLFTNIILLLCVGNKSYIFIIAYVVIYFVYWIFLEFNFNDIATNGNHGKFNKSLFINNISSGFTLMLGNFGTVLFTSIDRLIVKGFLGLINFAYYSFAVSLENILNAFVSPFSVTLYNYFCKNSDKEKVMLLKRFIIIFGAILIMSAFPAKFVIQHWISKYNSSLNVLFILFSAQFFSIIVKCFYNNIYKAEKKQHKYFKIMITMVLLSILFNFIGLCLNKSIEVIAIATLLINILWFITNEIDFHKYHFKFWEYIYIIAIILSFLLTSLVKNAIYGFMLYNLLFIIFTVIFMADYIRLLINELMNFIKRKKVLK